jgi:hypothetical protein
LYGFSPGIIKRACQKVTQSAYARSSHGPSLNRLKLMIKLSKWNRIDDVFHELHPFTIAFPTILSLIKGGLRIPVSFTTCERCFPKMKIIKAYLKSSMGEDRLSDLAVLAVKREIHFNFEGVVDVLAKIHKHSRIRVC